MTCEECKARLAQIPDDPTRGWVLPREKRERFGGLSYMKPLCHSCPNNSQEVLSMPAAEPEWTRRQWAAVEQLRARLLHTEKQLAELQKTKQKSRGEY